MLRDARKLNPDLFLFSSPWSPPAWMKFNRSMLGGTIRKSNLEAYSRYFEKFLEAYKAEGVSIDAVTVQNEVILPSMAVTRPASGRRKTRFFLSANTWDRSFATLRFSKDLGLRYNFYALGTRYRS